MIIRFQLHFPLLKDVLITWLIVLVEIQLGKFPCSWSCSLMFLDNVDDFMVFIVSISWRSPVLNFGGFPEILFLRQTMPSCTNFWHTLLAVFPETPSLSPSSVYFAGKYPDIPIPITTSFKNFVNYLPFQFFRQAFSPFIKSSFLAECHDSQRILHESHDNNFMSCDNFFCGSLW